MRRPSTSPLLAGPARDEAPLHLRLLDEHARATTGLGAPDNAFDSIPFFSLCQGLFLPLSGLTPERTAALFGPEAVLPRNSAPRDRRALAGEFLAKPIGLTLVEKLACLLGDPFLGGPSTFRQDRLLQLLRSTWLRGDRELLDRLAVVGELAALFAESRPTLECLPRLTAAETLRALAILPKQGLNVRMEAARSLLLRCGKLEAYFLARLLMSGAGLGAEFSDDSLAAILAEHAGIAPARVRRAIGLSDPFQTAQTLEAGGPAALDALRLAPLCAVRPALAASASAQTIERFPVWVERKYDGIRFLLHKSTDPSGAVRTAAFTRNRHDWLDRVPGLSTAIELFPGRSLILDGELFGDLHGSAGRRPADVAEVMRALHGELLPLSFRYTAFDLLYWEGHDLTGLPWCERRARLDQLIAAASLNPLPVAFSAAVGQMAESPAAVTRLFRHFVAQGHEGIVVKRPDGAYALGARDQHWLKRKVVDTLDLVLIGATFAVDNDRLGRFGSYVLGARTESGFADVGDVDGVDRDKDSEVQQLIWRHGLLTGRRIERQLTHGRRAGVELAPGIVVVVKFQKVQREPDGCVLRHPVVVAIRTDKTPGEADTLEALESRGS